MTTAKEMILVEDLKYWRSERPDEWTMDRFISKAMKLEQELSRLKESQTQKSIIKLCNRVDKAEADKAELVEFVRDIAYNDINKNDLDIDWVQKESWELLNKHTDKHDALQALKKDHPEFGGKK